MFLPLRDLQIVHKQSKDNYSVFIIPSPYNICPFLEFFAFIGNVLRIFNEKNLRNILPDTAYSHLRLHPLVLEISCSLRQRFSSGDRPQR
jgi:hypothetical protein